jgi:hypothetical protein
MGGKQTMTAQEWLDTNKDAIATRMAELKLQYPKATIIPPGYQSTLDGRTIFNDRFLIAE